MAAGQLVSQDDISGDDRIHDIIIKWSYDSVETLISIRVKYDPLFNGKRGTAQSGWLRVAEEMGFDTPELVWKQLQKKWANLLAKYRDVKYPPLGRTPEDGEPVTTTWNHFFSLDKFYREKGGCTAPSRAVLDPSKLPHLKFIAADSAVTNSELEMEVVQYDDFAQSDEHTPTRHIVPIITNKPSRTVSQPTSSITPTNITNTGTPSFKYKYKYKYKYKKTHKNKHKSPGTNDSSSESSDSSSSSDSETQSPVRDSHARRKTKKRKFASLDESATKGLKVEQSPLIVNSTDVRDD